MISADDVLGLAGGFRIAQAINTAAELGLAEHLVDGPLSGTEVAERASTDPRATTLLLRALASREVITETARDVFALNDAGRALLPAALGGSRELILGWVGSALVNASLTRLPEGVRSGRPAAELAFGRGFFAQLCGDPAALDAYVSAVGGSDPDEFVGLLDSVDLTGTSHLADLGGGGGGLVRAAVTRWPHLTGTVVDLPEVTARALELVAADGLSDRIDVVAADITRELPSGPDCFVMTTVLRYFDDATAGDLLTRIHQTLPTGGQLVMVEMPLPAGPAAAPSALKSLVEFALSGGQDRTLAELDALCRAAGFDEVATREWEDPYWIIQAR